MSKFSKGEAIQFGWEATKRHLGFFIIVLIIALVANAIPNRVQDATKETAPLLSFLFGLVSLFVGQVVAIGVTRISLRVHDREQPELADLFNRYALFFKYLFASLLYALIVAAGLILLIVPGIMWAVRFALYGYLVVDKGLGPVEALGQSAQLTQGARWDLFVFGLLLFGIILLGALALGVGLFLAFPTALMAGAFVYRRLLAAAGTPAAAQPMPSQAG